MRNFLLAVALATLGWIGYITWITPELSYPWELFIAKPDVEKTLAWKANESAWSEFRLNFQYHIQTIGVSNYEQDGSQLIIVSEPPSSFKPEDAEEFFKYFKFKTEIKTHTIGYDGWVKDLVIVVSGGSDRQKKIALDKLYACIYHSDYKPHYLDLTQTTTFASNEGGDNLSVSAAEINNWFIEGNDQWFYNSEKKDTEFSVKDLLSNGVCGIYYSKEPGFIGWVLPKGSISEHVKDIRRFTLDADAIIGAIANSTHVIIIGKERTHNEYALPPLRVETILQLAAADKEQISQSYERNNMFAGKIKGGKDWAPIYLSEDLINTEYGSLLNITDQMLKGWSLHGEVTYHNFMYPKPERYPIAKALDDELMIGSVTFNWNTKGAAYITQFNNLDIVAVNKTGALPVSYIPEGVDKNSIPIEKVRACEEKFYHFFSELKDPNLIRVVQYATIYQIFSAFNVTAYNYKNAQFSPSADVATAYAAQLLDKSLDLASQDLDQKREKLINEFYEKSVINNEIDTVALLQLYVNVDFIDAIKTLKSDLSNFNREALQILKQIIAHPRENFSYSNAGISDLEIHQLLDWFAAKSELFRRINNGIDYVGIKREEVMNKYVESFREVHSNWIKTPSIVVSWSIDSAIVTGGHNIDARMVGLKIDPSLASGQVKVIEFNGTKQLLVASTDVQKVSSTIIRQVETGVISGTQRIESKLWGGAIRDRGNVIPKYSYNTSARGFNTRFSSASKLIKNDLIFDNFGKSYKKVNINGKDFIYDPYAPNILFPEARIHEISDLVIAMKNRPLIAGEVKVISLVDDASTTSTLKNYAARDIIQNKINSSTELAQIFNKHPRKTISIVGHIENGQLVCGQSGTKLAIHEVQSLAQKSNVNLIIVGCESGFVPCVKSGFANRINSVEAAKALGMAIENSKDSYTFIHTLSQGKKLNFIIQEIPLKDLGFATQKARMQDAAAVIITTGAGTALVITILNMADGDRGDDRDSLRAK
jgi:hypothetical protein